MLDDQPDEARAADGAGHPLAALAVSVGEGHRVAVVGDQLLVADDAAIQIDGQRAGRRRGRGTRSWRYRRRLW